MYQVNTPNNWDTDYLHTLMGEKRIVSSKEAKEIREKLSFAGALPHLDANFDWAMLCIGYCFAKGLTENPHKLIAAPNAKGTEIPSFQTCFQDFSRLWLVMLSDTLFRFNPDKAVTKDDLYRLIADLWHTGAVELDRFWEGCKRFKRDDDLAARQIFLNELMDLAVKNAGAGSFSDGLDNGLETEMPSENNFSKQITEALQSMGKGVKKLDFQTSGVRYDFYLLQFSEYTDWSRIHERFCSALGVENNAVMAERCSGQPHAYNLKVKRPENTWRHLDKAFFQTALRQYNGNAVMPLCLGADETGKPKFDDLHKARHVLVGGTTGAGKSVMVRTLLHSLFAFMPSEKAEIAIFDPANDYAVFKDKPNLWRGEIHSNRDEMRSLLEEFVEEMDRRLEILREYDATEIRLLPDNERPKYLIILVEELAALLDNDKGAEKPLVQLLQEGRKTGIHLIMATQEPDSKTFSSRLRANIPSRIALKVSKPGSSEMILGETGAENLLGKGDHLVKWDNGTPYFLHGFDV